VRPIVPWFLSGHPLSLTQNLPQTLQAANPRGPHATDGHAKAGSDFSVRRLLRIQVKGRQEVPARFANEG